MFNCGIIGFGKMGKIRADVAKKCGINIISIYDISPPLKSEYNFVDSPDLIIGDEKIDIVFICTPNYLNKKYTISSLINNKHVFCEKPPALNSSELNEIMLVEKMSNKKLMYGLNHRHHDSVMKIKEIIDSHEFGDILWMRGRYGKNVDVDSINNWRFNKALSGGGILIDQGIHMLDLFLYMCGDFDVVQSIATNNYWKIDGIEDNVFINLKNNNTGVVASLHSTMTQWRHLFSFEIFLNGGYITLNGLKTPSGAYGEEILTLAKNESIVSTKRLYEKDYKFSTDNSWINEVSMFVSHIKNNTPIELGNSSDALKLMKLVERVYNENKL